VKMTPARLVWVQVALFAFLTFVPQPPLANAQARPCDEDAKKFCPDAEPGSGGVRRCLQEHLDQLSPECREQISRGRRRRHPPRFRGCEADLDKFCKDMPPGGGRLLNCLREHEADLSEECKKRLATGRGAGRGGGRGEGRGGRRMAGTPQSDATPKPGEVTPKTE
jgi:hypothetical protein